MTSCYVSMAPVSQTTLYPLNVHSLLFSLVTEPYSPQRHTKTQILAGHFTISCQFHSPMLSCSLATKFWTTWYEQSDLCNIQVIFLKQAHLPLLSPSLMLGESKQQLVQWLWTRIWNSHGRDDKAIPQPLPYGLLCVKESFILFSSFVLFVIAC